MVQSSRNSTGVGKMQDFPGLSFSNAYVENNRPDITIIDMQKCNCTYRPIMTVWLQDRKERDR